MTILEYTEFLVKSIALNPELVKVSEFPSEDEKIITLEIMIKDSDKGRVIGKNGKMIGAIRTLVQAYSYTLENKKVIINLDSF